MENIGMIYREYMAEIWPDETTHMISMLWWWSILKSDLNVYWLVAAQLYSNEKTLKYEDYKDILTLVCLSDRWRLVIFEILLLLSWCLDSLLALEAQGFIRTQIQSKQFSTLYHLSWLHWVCCRTVKITNHTVVSIHKN